MQDHAVLKDAEHRIRGVEKLAENGVTSKPEDMAATEARIASIDNPELRQQLQDAKDTLQWASAMRRMKPSEVEAEIKAMRASGADEDVGGNKRDLHRRKFAERLLANMHGELKQDPMGWADKTGVIKVEDIDASTVDALQATIKTRIGQAVTVGQAYDRPVQYLRPDEKVMLGAVMGQGGGETLGVMKAISAGAGDHAPKVFAELFENAPVVASLGAHVNEVGMTQVARDAADGITMKKKDETVMEKMPSAEEQRTSANETLRSTYADPDSRAALIHLTTAAYAARAARLRLTEFDGGLWKKTMRELVGEQEVGDGLYQSTYGGIVNQGTYHRNPIVLPPTLKASDRVSDVWRDAVDMITPDDLKAANLGTPVGGNGKPISMDRVKNGTLVQVGNGRYQIALGGGALTRGTEQYVQREGGGPFVLDFKALTPTLSRRRPDLFLGAK